MSHKHCWACLTASDSYSLLWSLLCYAFSFCVISSWACPIQDSAPTKAPSHVHTPSESSGTNLNTKKYHHWHKASLSRKLLECIGKSNYMLALFFYFFPGHKLLAIPTSEIGTLFSCLSWVYSLLILGFLGSKSLGIEWAWNCSAPCHCGCRTAAASA